MATKVRCGWVEQHHHLFYFFCFSFSSFSRTRCFCGVNIQDEAKEYLVPRLFRRACAGRTASRQPYLPALDHLLMCNARHYQHRHQSKQATKHTKEKGRYFTEYNLQAVLLTARDFFPPSPRAFYIHRNPSCAQLHWKSLISKASKPT